MPAGSWGADAASRRRPVRVRLRTIRLLCVVAATAALSGCAGRGRVVLPTDDGTPFPDVAEIHAPLAAACTGVRTLTAELGLSGRVDSQRIRGRLIAGFERPDRMRLEGVAPFGPPAFILAASPGAATLYLPRDRRVARDASAAVLLGALTGVSIAPRDLLAVLTGCVAALPQPTGGRRHGGGWASIDLQGGARLYLREAGGRWAVRAARLDDWQIDYDAWTGAFPGVVRLQTTRGEPAVDITAVVSQIMTNLEIDPGAFQVDVPEGTGETSVDALRQGSPWGR